MKLKPILTAIAVALAALAQPALANYTFDENGEPTHYKGIPLPPIQTVAEARASTEKKIAAAKAEEAKQAAQAGLSSNLQSEIGNQQLFYTGRPYVAALDGYLFMFRHFNPDIAKWNAADQSGFLDGANAYRYAPTPTSSLDYLGLLDWETLTARKLNGQQVTATDPESGVMWDVYDVKTNDGNHTVMLWKYLSGAPPDTNYAYNCHGYTFGDSAYWIQTSEVGKILQGDGWKQITGADKTGARIGVWDSTGGHSAIVEAIIEGSVTSVTGKNGHLDLRTTSPSQQWAGAVKYYE
jgi:RHS repeat-associated protein